MKLLRSILLLGICVFLTTASQAADTFWTGFASDGSWSNELNWDAGLPQAGYDVHISMLSSGEIVDYDYAYPEGTQFNSLDIDNENTLVLDLGYNLETVTNQDVGTFANGYLTQTAGTNIVGTNLTLGGSETGSGIYDLQGGILVVNNDMTVGSWGYGLVNQWEGTTAEVVHTLVLGDAIGTGEYYLSGDLSAEDEYIGLAGSGYFFQSLGTHQVNNFLTLGTYDGSWGNYDLIDGTLNVGSEIIGQEGSALFSQYGGQHNVTGWLSISTADMGRSVEDAPMYQLIDGELNTAVLSVGAADDGVFDQDGGFNNITWGLILGDADTGNGVYELSGGELGASTETVGVSGTGSLTQDGGTNNVGDSLYLGYNESGVGEYNLNDGELNSQYEYIGEAGTGTFNQNGGVNNVTRDLRIGGGYGGATSSVGTYNLVNGDLVVGVDESVGFFGTGIFNQEGGTHNISSWLLVGDFSNAVGTYNLKGGSLQAGVEHVGYEGQGTFNQFGGDNNISHDLTLGGYSYGVGAYNLNNGSLTATNEYIGDNGSGTFVQKGGSNTVLGSFVLGNAYGASGSYDLQGGELVASGETVGHSGKGLFTQEGGTNTTATLMIGDMGEGSYTLDGSAASLLAREYMIIGSSTGEFIQNNGTVDVGSLSIADRTGSFGSYTLNDGLLNIRTTLYTNCFDGIASDPWAVGYFLADAGYLVEIRPYEYRLTGSLVDIANVLSGLYPDQGKVSGSSFGMIVSDTDALVADLLANGYIGEDGSIQDAFRSLNNASELVLGGSYETTQLEDIYLVLSTANEWNAVIDVVAQASRNEIIGDYGHGIFTQNGGTHNISGLLSIGNNGGTGEYVQNGGSVNVGTALLIGDANGGIGTYTLNDGYLMVNTDHTWTETFIGNNGTGTFNQYGGVVDTTPGAMYLGNHLGSIGIYNMFGGELYAGGIALGEWAGTGKFYQNSGYVEARDLELARQQNSHGTYVLGNAFSTGAVLYVKGTEKIGGVSKGIFEQYSDTTHTIGGELVIGYLGQWSNDTGAIVQGNGSYQLKGGDLTVYGNEYIGLQGIGSFSQTGGTHYVGGSLVLGRSGKVRTPGDVWATVYGNGTYEMTGEQLNVQGTLVVGDTGIGSFTQYDIADVKAAGLWMGAQSTGEGEYNLSGDATLSTTLGATIGGAGQATFHQANNSVFKVGQDLRLGELATGKGTYTMDSGTLSVAGFMRVGDSGTGTFNQNGGNINVRGETGNGWVYINSQSRYNMAGGTLTAGVATYDGDGVETGFSAGTVVNDGVFNISGGTVADPVVVRGDVTNSGTVNVTSATVKFDGTFQNNGYFHSDPSVMSFNDLTIGASGYLSGSVGDQFQISGNFINSSQMNTLWFTGNSQLVFDSGIHMFQPNGVDKGAMAAGFEDNFAWGDVSFGDGQITLTSLSENQISALYAGTVSGLIIVGNTVENLFGDVNVYYMADSNEWLGGKTYAFASGKGELIPINTVVTPEPAAMLLYGLGGFPLAARFLRRRKVRG